MKTCPDCNGVVDLGNPCKRCDGLGVVCRICEISRNKQGAFRCTAAHFEFSMLPPSGLCKCGNIPPRCTCPKEKNEEIKAAEAKA